MTVYANRLISVLAIETGDLLVVRFSPMHVDALLEDAEDSAAECEANDEPRVYSVSTFGLIKTDEETVEELLHRICNEAPVGGQRVWLASGKALEQDGFVPWLSEPPPHHYDVILGDELLLPDVERLVKSFTTGRERNPAWKKQRS